MELRSLSGINRQRVSLGARLLIFLMVLWPLTVLAAPTDELKKLEDQIFSTTGLDLPDGEERVLKAFVIDDVLVPGTVSHDVGILCGWTQNSTIEQRTSHDLSLQISVFDLEKQKWVEKKLVDNFFCSGEEYTVTVDGLVPQNHKSGMYGLIPVKLVAMNNSHRKKPLYQSIGFMGYPCQKESLPEAVVFDVDRTLTTYHSSFCLDMSSCLPFPLMADEARHLAAKGLARTGEARDVTRQWLKEYNLPYGPVFMREKVPDLSNAGENERNQLESQSLIATKSSAIRTVQQYFRVVAGYGDSWTDIDVYKLFQLPEIVHVEWHEIDDDAIASLPTYTLDSTGRDSESGGVTIKRYIRNVAVAGQTEGEQLSDIEESLSLSDEVDSSKGGEFPESEIMRHRAKTVPPSGCQEGICNGTGLAVYPSFYPRRKNNRLFRLLCSFRAEHQCQVQSRGSRSSHL